VNLISDFKDFYDYAFDRESDRTFYRNAGDRSMPKMDQFRLLLTQGFKVPFVGTPDELIGSLGPSDLVVVYEDDRAHCGEGKILTEIDIAFHDYWDYPCSQWINSTGEYDRAQSYRLLQVGDRAWLLRYEGTGGWMSNHCDNTDIFIEGEIEALPNFGYPLFAIDFVNKVNDPAPETLEDLKRLFAIDFNSAPGMRWTGMNDILQAAEVVQLIRSALPQKNTPVFTPKNITINLDGDQYCVLLGSDMMIGVVAFGGTIQEAIDNFCEAWGRSDIFEQKRAIDSLTEVKS
jgi:hypothetical protein